MKHVILRESFYQHDDVVAHARNLLGKLLLTNLQGTITSGIIVETEAYRGPDDRGCHAFGGRYTERTRTMYLKGGHAYVYICYGIHPMVNVVTSSEGDAHAVLIRAIEPIDNIETMLARRKMRQPSPILTNGPGKLTMALGITKFMDGTTLFDEDSPIKILENGILLSESEVISGPRVGMSKHVGTCAHRPWRFYIKDNPWISKPLKVDYTNKW